MSTDIKFAVKKKYFPHARTYFQKSKDPNHIYFFISPKVPSSKLCISHSLYEEQILEKLGQYYRGEISVWIDKCGINSVEIL